jgi:hypothetical protein
MRFACRITKAQSMEYLLRFRCHNGCTNAPHWRALPVLCIKQCSLRLLALLSLITNIGRLTVCCTTICPYQYHISNVSCNFLYRCSDLLLLWAETFCRTARHFKKVFCNVQCKCLYSENWKAAYVWFYLLIKCYKSLVQVGKLQLPASFSKENSSCVETV